MAENEERTYVFRIPIRGEWFGTVTATSAAEARRKVDERHPDADGFDSAIDWSGKARVRLDQRSR